MYTREQLINALEKGVDIGTQYCSHSAQEQMKEEYLEAIAEASRPEQKEAIEREAEELYPFNPFDTTIMVLCKRKGYENAATKYTEEIQSKHAHIVELQKQNSDLKEELEKFYKADLEYEDENDRLTQENSELKAEAERFHIACDAILNDYLIICNKFNLKYRDHPNYQRLDKLLNQKKGGKG